MKHLLVAVFLSFPFLSHAQVVFGKVQVATFDNGTWSALKKTSGTFVFKSKGDSMFQLTYTGNENCPDIQVKFLEKDPDGNCYYVPDGPLDASWCGKDWQVLVMPADIDQVVKRQATMVQIFYDEKNGVAFALDR